MKRFEGTVKDAKKISEELRKNATPSQARVLQEADAAFESVNGLVMDFDSEDRLRKAGWLPSQAEEIAKIVKTKKVGEMFTYSDRTLVLTPFKTVVPAQNYVTALQDRVLELTTVEVEIEVANLKNTINEFKNLSFLGLIALSFKRLFKKG